VRWLADILIRVTTIDEVKSHPNADRLDLAVIGGWQCVVGKGNWHAGDRCVFFPPDTMLPEQRCKEFEVENYVSRSNRFPGMGRIKCAKLRGEPSFGLAVPVPDGMPDDLWDDCASWFGAEKYEPPVRMQLAGRKMYGRVDEPESIVCTRCLPDGTDTRDLNWIQNRENRGLSCSVCGYTRPLAAYAAPENPGFPKYTDIQNLRHYPDLFNSGEAIVVTEKIHGANCRVGIVKVGELPASGLPIYQDMAGSHNVRRTDPADNSEHPDQAHRSDTYWFPWTLPGVKELLVDMLPGHNSVVLYGEVFGPGIQTLDYGQEGLAFRAFDIKIDGTYLRYLDFEEACVRYGVEPVPFKGVLTWGETAMERVKAFASDKPFAGDHISEGVVLRPAEERTDPRVGRAVLKFVNDDYLLSKYHDEETDDDEYPGGGPAGLGELGEASEGEEDSPAESGRGSDHGGDDTVATSSVTVVSDGLPPHVP